jgi:hypothetical protein
MRFYLFNGLAVEGYHKVQHAVRGGVLRTNVDHEVTRFGGGG